MKRTTVQLQIETLEDRTLPSSTAFATPITTPVVSTPVSVITTPITTPVVTAPAPVSTTPITTPVVTASAPVTTSPITTPVVSAPVPVTTSPITTPVVSAPVAVVVAHPLHQLVGHGAGTFVSTPQNVDSGVRYQLNGQGQVDGLGQVWITGYLQGVGKVHGRATGLLTFSNSHGSVTVELTGAIQPSFSALPDSFTYKVVSATGRYHDLRSDHGTLQIKYIWSPVAYPLASSLRPIIPIEVIRGSFRITIE